MLFQKNLTRSGNALIFEHGEESVQGLVIGHCHHLLFLPAAGMMQQGNGYYPNQVWCWSAFSNVTERAIAVVGRPDRFRAFDQWSLFCFSAVRLASVVSEGLTQTWKCHIVFGIGCPRLSF